MSETKTPAPPAANAAPGAETLDDLAREAGPPPSSAAEEAPAGELVLPVAPSAGLAFGCCALVKVVGALVCGRAGVSPLSDAEVSSVGNALAGVAVYYLPNDADPRFMAWMTLVLAIGAVAAPRVKEARGDDAAQPHGT